MDLGRLPNLEPRSCGIRVGVLFLCLIAIDPLHFFDDPLHFFEDDGNGVQFVFVFVFEVTNIITDK